MTMIRLGIPGWCALLLVNIFLWAPLAVITLLGFSNANSMTFPPPDYSLRWLDTLLTSPSWMDSITTSVLIGLCCVALSLCLGVPLGLGLSKGRIGRLRLLYVLIMLPLILPAISLAIGFYFVSARLELLDTLLPLVLSHSLVGVSYVALTVIAANSSLDKSLEMAARTLGASFFHAIRTITLPLISVGVVGGAVLAFLHSWDDVVNALMLGTARIQPFPLKLWGEMQNMLNPVTATASVLLSVISIAVIGLVSLFYLLRKRRLPAGQAADIIMRKGAIS